MSIIRLDSIHDERFSEFRHVPKPELLVQRGLFVAEGRMVVRRLLEDTPLEVRSLLLTEAALTSLDDLLTTRPRLNVYVVPQWMMNEVTGFNFHRGCLAIGVRPPARNWRELLSGASRLVVLERVGNADNVGSIFRNAAAFGVDAVLLQSACADPLYRKAIRTSMAASLIVPYASANPWPGVLTELLQNGWATLALTPSATATPLSAAKDEIGDRSVALVLGHEGHGLTREALAACSHRARIPVREGVDSLNVATAAAITLYEVMGSGVIS